MGRSLQSSGRAPGRRAALTRNPELQAIVCFFRRMFVTFGPETVRYAETLAEVGWSYEKAGLLLGVPAVNIRQQVHRMELRMREVLGGRFSVTALLRPRVVYGADDAERGVYGFEESSEGAVPPEE